MGRGGAGSFGPDRRLPKAKGNRTHVGVFRVLRSVNCQFSVKWKKMGIHLRVCVVSTRQSFP
jgi:hypothetical protein